VPRVHLSTVGKREFSVSGATVWNDLPSHVTSAPSLAIFRQRLKSFLFSVLFEHSYLTHIAYYYFFIFVDLAIIRDHSFPQKNTVNFARHFLKFYGLPWQTASKSVAIVK